MRSIHLAALGAALVAGCAAHPVTPPGPTAAEVLAASAPSDWREPDPENTLYLELATGRVVIELAPAYAPHHVANIRALAREKYFDGLSIIRAQDNYVVQWGDAEEDPKKQRPVKSAQRALAPEFARETAPDLPFTKLADGDIYAPEAGHSAGFPAARDGRSAWLTHCYGMVGAGRGNTPGSGSGAELYVVIGHAPRHLDRNVTLVGRVVKGMELLSSLPRGTGPLGFYEKKSQFVPIRSVRVAADVPEKKRTRLELLRTDTPTWTKWVDARRHRREEWFVDKAGHVELCNVPLAAREKE